MIIVNNSYSSLKVKVGGKITYSEHIYFISECPFRKNYNIILIVGLGSVTTNSMKFQMAAFVSQSLFHNLV
jgi:hypothetical protein